jgi:3-hydroxyisobutyrate dehydrogenase-like beta-hydroxyacid dehydrogenase
MVHSLSEAYDFASRQGVEPETFFEAVNNAVFQSALYDAYVKIGVPGMKG